MSRKEALQHPHQVTRWRLDQLLDVFMRRHLVNCGNIRKYNHNPNSVSAHERGQGAAQTISPARHGRARGQHLLCNRCDIVQSHFVNALQQVLARLPIITLTEKKAYRVFINYPQEKQV
jgi:hypothetical protein